MPSESTLINDHMEYPSIQSRNKCDVDLCFEERGCVQVAHLCCDKSLLVGMGHVANCFQMFLLLLEQDYAMAAVLEMDNNPFV